MARGFRQGKFEPNHPGKYRGNINNIVYRSSWELDFCRFLDGNPNVIEWASEELYIPYIKPTDGKMHKYYPDFWVKYKTANGKTKQELIEVKPSGQSRPPKTVGKKKRQQLVEQITYAVNIAKWKAASDFCNKYGITFRILTEREIYK